MDFYSMRPREQQEAMKAICEMLNRQPGITDAYWKWHESTVARIYAHLETAVGDIHITIDRYLDELWDKAQEN